MASMQALAVVSLFALCAALSSTPGSGTLEAVGGHDDFQAMGTVDAEANIELLQGRSKQRLIQDPPPSDEEAPADEASDETAAEDAAPADEEAPADDGSPADEAAPATDEAAPAPAPADAAPAPADGSAPAPADAVADALAPAPAADVFRVNSAGPHTPVEVVADRVVLAIVIVMPLLIFFALRDSDRRKDELQPEQAALRRMDGYRQTPEGMRIEEGGFSPSSLYSSAFSDSYGEGSFMRNVLSGVSTSLVCIPQAISFSFVLGVSPLNGIWAGAVLGLYSALIGGRPGMISCAAAATAVVLQEISREPHLGIGPMAVAVGICGVLQVLVGMLRLSRFVSLVPHTVMLGFMNGIAILISLGQLTVFQERSTGEWVEREMLRGMIFTCIVAMLAAVLFKRIPFIGNLIPAPIIAVAAASIYSYLTRGLHPMRTLEDVGGEGTFSGGWAALPALNFPAGEVHWDDGEMWAQCTLVGAQMALVGLIESLLTITVIDQITETRGSPQREVFAQGMGNMACAAFGLQGGCTVVGQSLLNVSSGGRSRVSGVTCAICLALSVIIFGPLVGQLPVAALAGIMFLVGINTFCWGVFRLLHQMDLADILVIVLVTVLAVMVDLASAVIAGLCFAAVAFAWRAAQDANLEELSTAQGHEFRLHGPLFFASAISYTRQIEADRINEKVVILDFTNGQVLDHSGLNAVAETCDRLAERGKQVIRHGLPREAEQALACMTQKGTSMPSPPAAAVRQLSPVAYAPATVMRPEGPRILMASAPQLGPIVPPRSSDLSGPGRSALSADRVRR